MYYIITMEKFHKKVSKQKNSYEHRASKQRVVPNSTTASHDARRPLALSAWCSQRMVGVDDGVPPFHTLVGPAQFARLDRSSEEAQPGGERESGFAYVLRALPF